MFEQLNLAGCPEHKNEETLDHLMDNPYFLIWKISEGSTLGKLKENCCKRSFLQQLMRNFIYLLLHDK